VKAFVRSRLCGDQQQLAVRTGASRTKVDVASAERKRRTGCGGPSLRCGMRGVGVSEECVWCEVVLMSSCTGPSLTHPLALHEHLSPIPKH
jgi:hypothetical protein